MKQYDYYNGSEWTKVSDNFLGNNISRDGIESLMFAGIDKLQVNYKDSREIFYDNVHGTWGNPTTFE